FTLKLQFSGGTRGSRRGESRFCGTHCLQRIANFCFDGLFGLLELISNAIAQRERASEIRFGGAISQWKRNANTNAEGWILLIKQVSQRLTVASDQIWGDGGGPGCSGQRRQSCQHREVVDALGQHGSTGAAGTRLHKSTGQACRRIGAHEIDLWFCLIAEITNVESINVGGCSQLCQLGPVVECSFYRYLNRHARSFKA